MDQDPITADSRVRDLIARYPETGPIFLQHGRMFRTRPGHLYADYDPPLTVGEYAALNGIDAGPLLRLLDAAAETAGRLETSGNSPPTEARAGGQGGTPPIGPGGAPGRHREQGEAATEDVSVVTTLEARGPV